MNAITTLKTVNEEIENGDFQVEYEILSPIDISALSDPNRREIALALQDVDKQISMCEDEIAKLNKEIDKLTNHADGLDYTIAVASGILTGLIDSFFVGETDFKGSIKKVDKSFVEKVKKKALKEKQDDTVKKAIEGAKKKGKTLSKDEIEKIKKNVEQKFYSDPKKLTEQGKDPVLKRAISFLEKKHPTPQDNLYRGTGGAPSNHHLHDITHHASLAGMVASIVVQFLRVATFVNKEGEWEFKFVEAEPKELLDMWLPIAISGLLNWLVCLAENTIKTEDGEKLPEPIIKVAHLLASTPAIVQVIKAVDNWCLHLYSDIAGSKSSKGRGAGIPGLFISLLKELSSVPPLNLTELPKAIDYLYTNKKIDLRAEIGIAKELGRQALPTIINEVLVRTFYFVRRLVIEYKKNESFEGVDWQNVIPFGNRTVERMMTIASGTFTAVDMADAAIRGAINSGGTGAGFAKEFVLRVNFVGVGRFAIAIGVDVGMGIKRNKLVNERIKVMGQELTLLNAKVYYKSAQLHYAEMDMLEAEEDMWIAAQDAEGTLTEAYEVCEEAAIFIQESLAMINQHMEKISDYRQSIEEHNPGLAKDLTNILRYGRK